MSNIRYLIVTVLTMSLVLFTPALAQIGGSGTSGRIPKFTAPTAIGDSVIFQSTTGKIGIGTANPQEVLDVIGGAFFRGNSTRAMFAANQNGTGDIADFLQGGSYKVVITNTGNVGIGTANPSASLHVSRPDGSNSGDYTAKIVNLDVTDNQGQGLLIQAGNGVNDSPLRIQNRVGTNLVSVRADGNVGIGTASPTAKLDVNGVIRTVNEVDAGGAQYALIAFNGTRAILAGSGTPRPDLALVTNDTERMVITTAGKVGIGTASPAVKLHVVDPTSTTQLRLGDGTGDTVLQMTAAGVVQSSLRVDSNNRLLLNNDQVTIVGNKMGIGTASPTETLQVVGTIHSTSGGFKFPDGTVQLTANGANAWIVNGGDIYSANSGNVGIGTNAPNKPLHVKGINALARFESTAASALIYFTPSGQKEWSIGAGSINLGDFGIHNTTDGIEALNITAAGNVGIGTVAPTQKLDVAGGLRVEGLVNCDTIDTDATGLLFCGTDATGGTGGGGVTSLNGATGAMSIVGGGSATIATNGNTITISTPTCTPFNSPIACSSSSNSCPADCPTGYIIVNWSCGGTALPTISGNRGSCTGSFGPVQGAGNCQKSC